MQPNARTQFYIRPKQDAAQLRTTVLWIRRVSTLYAPGKAIFSVRTQIIRGSARRGAAGHDAAPGRATSAWSRVDGSMHSSP